MNSLDINLILDCLKESSKHSSHCLYMQQHVDGFPSEVLSVNFKSYQKCVIHIADPGRPLYLSVQNTAYNALH